MSKKIRINITVDEKLLKKARKKLEFFGGKLSTLFNAYLSDFVLSTEIDIGGRTREDLVKKMEELEKRIDKLEK